MEGVQTDRLKLVLICLAATIRSDAGRRVLCRQRRKVQMQAFSTQERFTHTYAHTHSFSCQGLFVVLTVFSIVHYICFVTAIANCSQGSSQ